MKYLDEFFKFNCLPHLIDSIFPINNTSKEITEAMAIRKILRTITLKNQNKYSVIDMCSGNCLIGALAAYTLPINHSYSIDIKKRDRKFDNINKFTFIETSIYEYDNINEPSIIIGCHACSDLSKQIVNIYNTYENIKYIILMPCCNGKMEPNYFNSLIENQMSKYDMWTLYLYNKIEKSKKQIIKDNHVISNKNNIIVGSKYGCNKEN